MKNLTKYQKQSRVMKQAWGMYKDYDKEISFKSCLCTAWNLERNIITNGVSKDTDVSTLKTAVYMYNNSTDALHILITVRDKSNGFQKDIALKALDGIMISEKQAWCIAYEYKKVA